jgi:transcriptional regulator with XRE-family HTH domain
MVETGKRMPSADMLEMLAGIFSKEPRWFLDENTEVEAAPARRERGGLEAMPLGAGISVLARAAAERVAGTAVADRHHRPAIRAAADSRLAGNPAQQFSRYRTGGRGGGKRRCR